MTRWRSLAAILIIGFGIVAAGHYYLWARLVRDVGFTTSTTTALTWALCGLAVSIPTAVITSRMVPPRHSVWWVKPVYFWIGVSSLILLCLVPLDLLRLGPRLVAFLAVAIALVASVWAAREASDVRVKRVEVPLQKLPNELDGLTIVQLSDLHVGPTIGRDFIERVVATVNALRPDVVAITGDLVDASVEDLEHDVAPLARLKSTHGTYFVTGNHEYHAGAPEWCDHLGSLGIRVLRNEYVELERGGEVLHLAGIDDYESAQFGIGHGADLPKAVAGRDPSRALILLAHQPKAVHEAARHGVDLQLSGHTHGGQLWPFGWFVRLGQPVIAGLARFGETLIYVSCGTGYSGPPMRLNAPAEITHVVLRSTPDSRQ